MVTEEQNSEVSIPSDARIVKQVQYAWIWSSMPWVLVVVVLYWIGFFPEPLMTLIVILAIMVPRFMMWRGTRYILTKEALVYQRGGLIGSNRYQIPFSRLSDSRAKYGAFGRALGYQTVEIVFNSGDVASLKYVPIFDDAPEAIKELIADASGEDEEGEEDEPVSDSSNPETGPN